jgi:hypothetical protein
MADSLASTPRLSGGLTAFHFFLCSYYVTFRSHASEEDIHQSILALAFNYACIDGTDHPLVIDRRHTDGSLLCLTDADGLIDLALLLKPRVAPDGLAIGPGESSFRLLLSGGLTTSQSKRYQTNGNEYELHELLPSEGIYSAYRGEAWQ